MTLLEKIGQAWEKFQARYCRYFGRNYKCGCGHIAKKKTILIIDGHKGIYKASDYCPQCFKEAVIKCAWCGGSIIPGDAITLYSPGARDEIFVSSRGPNEVQKKRRQEDCLVPDHATVYQRTPRLLLVGCLRWDCADTGADRAGFWVMPGQVQRVMTPLEELSARGGDDPMMFSDVTDPKKSIPISDRASDD